MKKITLAALAAVAALSASAQYTSDPTTETVLNAGKVSSMQYIALDEASVNAFKAQGATVEFFGPDGATQNLWVWSDTFQAGDSSFPGVGMHFEGYASFVVGSAGWSGAGYNINADGAGNTTTWNDDTRFHIAYMSPSAPCSSVALIIADGEEDCGSAPAKVALGTAYVDNGAVYPAVAPAPNDDWQGLDISFANLKKLWPTFNPKAITAWKGNILAFLAGGVTGQTLALDAIYYYNQGEAGVANIENAADWVVTRNTINVAGSNGIELYDITGKLVKSTAGTTLGLDNLASGVYVARSGNSARKIVK
ncbi:MAG: T9SS type A sorting domain-containing protein [Muribaculaceae bacterium]|nr:T9SS type A sorting domain-containing protein [Muribaculaceae bacterium]